MPRVPTYDNFQVTPTSMPNARIDAAMTPEMATIGTRQMEQLGNQLQRAGGQFAQIADDANRVRVDDALNKLREKQLHLTYDKDVGFTNQVGVNALERKSGKSLTEEYDETFQNQASEIGSGLGNDAQRAMFMAKANEMRVGFTGQTTKHEADQFREYTLSVREGTVKNRMNEITLRYNDPAAVEENVAAIKAAVYDQGRLLGKSAEWVDAQARSMTSKAHTMAVAAALEKNDPEYAEGYLGKFSGEMEGDDLLRVRGLVTKEVDHKVGVQVASRVMDSMSPQLETTDLDRAHNILLNSESGGRQVDADGKLIVSPKGAIGMGQIMPSTGPEAAQLAGLKWDAEKLKTDPEYNKALSKAYFTQMLKEFDGDLTAAYAAYNAGPNAVRTAMRSIEREQSEVYGPLADKKSYLELLPKETQDYVSKNMKKYSEGGGSYEMPTIQQIHASIREQLGPNARPERLKVALDESDRLYNDFVHAKKQREDEAVATAMKALVQNGGRYSLLPPSIRDAIPAKEIGGVMSFGERVAKGDDVSSMALYQKLATDEAFLKGLSDAEFYKLRAELSESDFKHFSNERAKVRGGAASQRPDDLNSASINSIVNTRLMSIGVDPTPKETKKSEIQRVAAIRKYINDSVLAEQKQRGAKLSDQELSQHVDRIFMQTAMTKGGFFSADRQGRMIAMTADEIPEEIRSRLEADFESMGIEATDADLLEAYWKISSKRR